MRTDATTTAPSVRCFYCHHPVPETERRTISASRGMFAHQSVADCAIADRRHREGRPQTPEATA